MTTNIRLLFLPDLDPFELQAMRDMLVKMVNIKESPNTLMFSQASIPSISHGMMSKTTEKIKIKYCKDNNIPITRSIFGHKSSGFHGSGRIRCMFFIHKDSFPTEENRENFHNASIHSLDLLGIKGVHPKGSNNMNVGEKKISSIHVREFGNMFVYSFNMYFKSTREMAKKTLISIRDIDTHTTDIESELGRVIKFEEMRDIIIRGFQETLPLVFEDGNLTMDEESEIERLLVKHKSSDWINRGQWSPIKDYGV